MPGKRRRIHFGLLVCSLILGLLTTAAIVAGSAYVLPFKRPSMRGYVEPVNVYPTQWPAPATMTFRERVESIVAPMETEVATWGDHLQPWHIRLTTPTATRLIWFEKGRVYGKTPAVGPPQASGAAVACWSFATDCWRITHEKTTGPLPLPTAITELTQSNPRKAWGVAIEERGWPFRAATCRIIGTMDADAPEAYVIEGGIVANTAAGLSGAIQEQPVIPLRPLWPGLVADTVLMAGAWYGLLLLPGGVRRALRRGRGRCIECGYDLHGQTVPGCPECGWGRKSAEPV